MQMQWNDIVGVLGSVASIVGLPIAIYQIRSAKSRIQAAESAVKQLAEINKYQKYQGIIKTLEELFNNTSSLISDWDKRGVRKKNQENSVRGIIQSVHHCIVELPEGTEDSALNAAVSFFEDAIREDSVDLLRSAKAQLHMALSELKERAERITDEENKIIAKGSQSS